MRCKLSEGGRLERKDDLQDGNADGFPTSSVAPFVGAGRLLYFEIKTTII